MKSSSDSNQLPNETAPKAPTPDLLCACREDAQFLSAVRRVLEEAQLLASRHAQICLGGGGCCKFDLAGFRLYLSTGEAALLSTLKAPDPANAAKGRCPYQVGPRCLARDVRPLGCRMHFCRNPLLANKTSSDNETLYEQMHARIRKLHELSGHPYAYKDLIDWFSET